MVRRCFFGVLLAMLILSASMTANAQRGQGFGRGGMMGGGLALLRIPEVQKELKMTEAQIAKIEAKQGEVREAMQGIFQSGGDPRDMTAEERARMMAKMQEVQTKAVNDILTDDAQKKRFRQLELQRAGANALTRPDVAAELKLTDDQKKKIADIQAGSQEEMRNVFQGAGNPQDMTQEERQKFQAKMQDLQKATGDKMTGVLTDAQKAQWKEMTGAPFTFPPMQFGGRRGN
jgi:Spy/CpxP family protein refolding chaperone